MRRPHTTGDPIARLTTTERQDAYLSGISRQVNKACTKWLLERGLGSGSIPTSESHFKALAEATAGQETDAGEDDTGGQVKSSPKGNCIPFPIPFSYAPRNTKKREAIRES